MTVALKRFIFQPTYCVLWRVGTFCDRKHRGMCARTENRCQVPLQRGHPRHALSTDCRIAVSKGGW